MAEISTQSAQSIWGHFWRLWPYIAVTILAAVVMVGIASSEVQKAYEQHLANEYATVEGTILESKTQRFTGSGGGRGGRTTSYAASVTYSYEVNGQSFTGSRIRATGSVTFSQREQARAHAAHYPKNSSVAVHYHPERPEQSLLEPGFAVPEMKNLAIVKAFLSAPLLFWLVAVGMIRSGRRSTKTGRLQIDRKSGMVVGQSPDIEPWLVAGVVATLANAVAAFFVAMFPTLQLQLAAEIAGWVFVVIVTVVTYRRAKRLSDNP